MAGAWIGDFEEPEELPFEKEDLLVLRPVTARHSPLDVESVRLTEPAERDDIVVAVREARERS